MNSIKQACTYMTIEFTTQVGWKMLENSKLLVLVTLVLLSPQLSAGGRAIKKFKKISKRNIPNVGMGGWIKALADCGVSCMYCYCYYYCY